MERVLVIPFRERAGKTVWPREVKEVIYAHPAVKVVAVVGLQDSYRGEAVKAFVVLKRSLDGKVAEEEIIKFCKVRLAGYKVPRVVEFRNALPVSAAGKVLRRALKEDAKTGQKNPLGDKS